MDSVVLEHKHYILRIELKPDERLQDASFIENWMLDIINSIDMKVLIPPIAKYCDEKNNRGITAISAIQTSHMALHIWDEVNPVIMQFDIYSCKDFDHKNILENIESIFESVGFTFYLLKREPYIDQLVAEFK